jgi:hypothetical protein
LWIGWTGFPIGTQETAIAIRAVDKSIAIGRLDRERWEVRCLTALLPAHNIYIIYEHARIYVRRNILKFDQRVTFGGIKD